MMATRKIVIGVLTLFAVLFMDEFSPLAAEESATSPQAMPEEEAVAPQTKEGEQPEGTVIGHLKTRDQVISITTGPDGPLYTIRSKEGQEIAIHLTKEELATRFPDLHEKIEKSMADPKIWAGIELSVGQEPK
jgi:hypothetical protein